MFKKSYQSFSLLPNVFSHGYIRSCFIAKVTSGMVLEQSFVSVSKHQRRAVSFPPWHQSVSVLLEAAFPPEQMRRGCASAALQNAWACTGQSMLHKYFISRLNVCSTCWHRFLWKVLPRSLAPLRNKPGLCRRHLAPSPPQSRGRALATGSRGGRCCPAASFGGGVRGTGCDARPSTTKRGPPSPFHF